MERVWGPLNGFFIAAYAAPAGRGGRYASYAKVCWSRPASYWEADCAFKIFGGEQHRSLESALSWVSLEARNEVSHLPRQAEPKPRRSAAAALVPRLLAPLVPQPQRLA